MYVTLFERENLTVKTNKPFFSPSQLQEVEEWNEFGELKEVIGPVATTATSITTTPAKTTTGPSTFSSNATPTKAPPDSAPIPATSDGGASSESTLAASVPLALKQAAFEVASAVKERQAGADAAPAPAATGTPSKKPTEEAIAGVASPTSPGRAAGRQLQREGSASSSTSSHHFVPEHYDPPPTTHRGSSVSLASEAEIREIECKEAIPEEDEDEEEETATNKPAEVKPAEVKPTEVKLAGDKPTEKPTDGNDITAEVEKDIQTLKVTDTDDAK
jgi:hypothetical protein